MARRDEAAAGRTLLASFCIEVDEEVEISTVDETGGGGNGLKQLNKNLLIQTAVVETPVGVLERRAK